MRNLLRPPQIAPPAKGFDEETPTKRGHVNLRPNVKQAVQSETQGASSEQDLGSMGSQTTLDDGESGELGSEGGSTMKGNDLTVLPATMKRLVLVKKSRVL